MSTNIDIDCTSLDEFLAPVAAPSPVAPAPIPLSAEPGGEWAAMAETIAMGSASTSTPVAALPRHRRSQRERDLAARVSVADAEAKAREEEREAPPHPVADDPAAEMIRHLLADADAGLAPGRVAHAILRLERERQSRDDKLAVPPRQSIRPQEVPTDNNKGSRHDPA